MKYIIVGLGNFGASLAEKLTAQGNEVMGIDTSMDKVDRFKEKISHTICMNATDETTVAGLPLEDTDVVIVAIGEDHGANIMTTALFKNLKVKRLISRAVSELQQNVLEAMGVDEIIHPEEESAERWSNKLSMSNVVDSFELSDKFSIIEINVPEEYIDQTIMEVGFRDKYRLLVLTTIKQIEVNSILGHGRIENKVQGVADSKTVLRKDDILVLYGAKKDLEQFINQKKRK